MHAHADKGRDNQSRAVANQPSRHRGGSKTAPPFVDNRPEAKQLQRIREVVDNSPQAQAVTQLTNGTAQLMSEQEEELITNWIRMHAADYLTDVPPGLITDAQRSQAVRLRWFNLALGGVGYKVGLNIHYGGSTIGGVWVTNTNTNETLAFHPYAPPQHGFGSYLIDKLRLHVKSQDEMLAQKIEP